MIVQLTDQDGRVYQHVFPTRELQRNEGTSMLLVFSRLSQPHNSVSLFMDCMDMGVDQTEVPLRRIFGRNMTVVIISSLPCCCFFFNMKSTMTDSLQHLTKFWLCITFVPTLFLAIYYICVMRWNIRALWIIAIVLFILRGTLLWSLVYGWVIIASHIITFITWFLLKNILLSVLHSIFHFPISLSFIYYVFPD